MLLKFTHRKFFLNKKNKCVKIVPQQFDIFVVLPTNPVCPNYTVEMRRMPIKNIYDHSMAEGSNLLK